MPDEHLASIQRRILHRVLYAGPVSPAAYAGVPGRAAFGAAERHLTRLGVQVVRLDVRDAYGSTAYRHVTRALRARLRQELWMLGVDRATAVGAVGALADLVMIERAAGGGRQLPLGAPTSLAVFNLVWLDLDAALVARAAGGTGPAEVVYTRYVDDLVFSGPSDALDDIEAAAVDLLARKGYVLNGGKRRRTPVDQAEVYGFMAGQKGPELSPRLRERYAGQIRHHLTRAADPRLGAAAREQSRHSLGGIDRALRTMYEDRRIPRPSDLGFTAPPAAPAPPLFHPDPLWR